MDPIRFGIDRLLAGDVRVAKSVRVGLVTNDTARLASDVNVRGRATLREAGFNLVRLFSPEHGLAAAAADGDAVADSTDPLTGLPVISLYGESHRPAAQQLRDLDVVMFDIPDVGARFYTYIWTLSHVLEACADAGKTLVVLDRPNPIGGELQSCEGPMLDESRFSTFVGRWNIPIRHGLTLGELATLWNAERKIDCELRVVTVENWTRNMHWPQTNLPFVPTSPAMPSYETALVYPGTCLFEGTNLSEGRGTDSPFRLIGAPWADGEGIAQEFNRLDLPGVRADAARFTPAGRKFAGRECQGVRLNVTDSGVFRPVATGLHLVATFLQRHPVRFTWSPYPTAANVDGGGHFDRLVGSAEMRTSLTAKPIEVADRVMNWTRASGWHERVRRHLLYP